MSVVKIKKRILVVDDEKLIRWSLQNKLSSWGYTAETAENAAEAYSCLKKKQPDLVLLDIKLPDGNGMEILEKIRSIYDDTAVIMITAEATIETAVKAMKLGAYDYITKPFNLEEMHVLIKKALEKSEMKKSLEFYETHQRSSLTREPIIGESKSFREVMELVGKVSSSPVATVLLLGESGTGKNVLARAIHCKSERADKPFVTIECAAIPENLLESELFGYEKGAFTDARSTKKGLFELANNGTIFIDEIGDLPLLMQAKLLHAIEEKRFKRVGGVIDYEVDVRIIAATNLDLEMAVQQKQFRRDLYFRLNVVPICLPPLRERDNDIILLANHFMESFNRQFNKSFSRITSNARKQLLEHTWPGNVRELRNIFERAILLEQGEELKSKYLALKPARRLEVATGVFRLDSDKTMDEMETEMIAAAMSKAGGNQTKAAKALGITRDVLRYRIKKYKLKD